MVKTPTLADYIKSAVTVHAVNGYVYTGTLLAVDRHMNMVVSSCCCRLNEKVRSLGLTIIRGEEVAFFTSNKEVTQVKPAAPAKKQSTKSLKSAKPSKPVQSTQVAESSKSEAPSTTQAKPSLIIPGLGRPLKNKVKG